MKRIHLIVFLLCVSSFVSINYSYAGDSPIDQNEIDRGNTSPSTADINGFCDSAADCAAVNNQVNQNQAAANNTTNTDTSTNNVLGIPNNQLRTGTVDMDTIPQVLVSIINVLLGVAGTISIVALIYYAIQMQINSGITGDSSGVDNAKKGMKGAILGFIVAILAWFIVIRFIEILSSLS